MKAPQRQGTRKKNLRAHELLVRQGICSGSDEAKRWILAGKVIVNDRRVAKAGEWVPADAKVRVSGMRPYVGKGGHKLEGALSAFAIRVDGITALDAGASTGGFTDCLLQHGAERVYAVDAGYGMLAGKLRNDDRVVNLERTNISDLTTDDLDPLPSLATVDLSYLSLKKAIPVVARLLAADGRMLCLVKPLFEVPDPEARRRGRIANATAYRDVLNDLRQFVKNEGLSLLGLTHSRVRGNKGTVEFWLWIAEGSAPYVEPAVDVEGAVEAALTLPAWKGNGSDTL